LASQASKAYHFDAERSQIPIAKPSLPGINNQACGALSTVFRIE
jgi:hypothetical protein